MAERLQATQQRQQQILAFLAKAVQTPGFLAHLVAQNENNRRTAATASKRRRLSKEEDEGEVEDCFDYTTPADGQIVTIQNNGEVVSQIMQLLNPPDGSSPTIDNSHLHSLLRDYTSTLAASEGNTLNRQSGVTVTDLSTGLTEHLQSDPVVTDTRNNEGIVQLPPSPKSDNARVAGIRSYTYFPTINGTLNSVISWASACHFILVTSISLDPVQNWFLDHITSLILEV
jgi:hypothetical protein